MKDARRQAENEIARLDQPSSSLTRQFNASFAPACRIPLEILSAIFEHMQSPTRSEDVIRPQWNPAVAQVCSFWRETAMKTPCLWNRIDTSDRGISMKLYDHFQFPVHIHWYFDDFLNDDIKSFREAEPDPQEFSRVFKHPARILSIAIFADRTEIIRALLAKMAGGPAPLLTSLELHVESDVIRGGHVPELKALRLPMLRALSLGDIAVPWGADFMQGPHLRRLELSNPASKWRSRSPVAAPALPTVLATLAGLPNLEVLKWTWYLPQLWSGPPLQAVPMPSLRTLALEGLMAGCVDLAHHLSPARPILAHLNCEGGDDDDAVAAALWDVAARYWVPNTSAPPNAEVFLGHKPFVLSLVGTAPGGNDQELCFEFMPDRWAIKHAVLRKLGLRLTRVQTPTHLQLQVQLKSDECQRFVGGLTGLSPGLSISGSRTLKYLVDSLMDEGSGDKEGAMLGCLSNLTISDYADRLEDGVKLEKAINVAIRHIERLCSALDKLRALGVATLRSLTFVNCPRLSGETVRELLSTYDENLQVTISN
jgi:hypothetical protein